MVIRWLAWLPRSPRRKEAPGHGLLCETLSLGAEREVFRELPFLLQGGEQRRVPALADHGGGGLDFHGCSGQSGLSLNSGGGASIPGVEDIFIEYFGKKEMGRE